MAKTSVFGIANTRNQAEAIVTGLQTADFPSDDISALFSDKIRDGNILISVHTDDAAQIARAQEAFREAGANDVCVTGETPNKP